MRLMLVLGTIWLLVGCAGERARVEAQAEAAGFVRHDVAAGRYTLASWYRSSDPNPTRLIVYIEGDGYAWVHRDRPSRDPTPHAPVALALASQDPRPAILYLARPCQYLLVPPCTVADWTVNRFASPMIEAISLALDRWINTTGATQVELVGYSGGGVVAALVTARRRAAGRFDVQRLVTVAAPLDLAAWIRHHQITPFPVEDWPSRYTEWLRPVPQVHYVGGQDEIVPADVVAGYLASLQPLAGRMETVAAAGHQRGWEGVWRTLILADKDMVDFSSGRYSY